MILQIMEKYEEEGLFSFASVFCSKANKLFDPLIIALLTFTVLSFVPSSSIRLSLMWAPLFIFYMTLSQTRKVSQ